MAPDDMQASLGGEATFAGAPKRRPVDASLGDERTLGGGDTAGIDTVIDDIEVVDLEGRYTIEGTLGQGGMGAVLLATDTRLDRKVAIKRILGEASRSKTAIMRFLTEAKSIAALNHPNIVQIYDYGRAKDGPFLIMEYVDGGSLLDRCRDGAMPLENAVDLACQLCDGLAKAHDAGIVHRDIKPANVLLNRDGHPKLTDFGLAKAETADHGMTMTGAVMGTPDFMPPEQRRDAAEVDARSDLWSLAATVYQMVTGRNPKIIRFNDVPAALQDVLAKALEEAKDARYQSAREFRDALKTSVRAAAAVIDDRGEGVCPSCGVKNDSRRRYCGGCGGALEADCLSCTKPMPMWEEICGECGTKQTPLVQEKRAAMAARQAEAEGLLGDFEFDRAMGIATQLRDEPHPKLKHLSGWASSFLNQIEKSRAEQTQQAVEAMAQAGKHEAAYDYLSAASALETIPQKMRSTVLPGMREPAARILDRVIATQAEARRLETLIQHRVAAKQLDELLPEVENLLRLRPDRVDVQKIRGQLVERAQRQASSRDEAVAAAKAALASHDYEAACGALSGVAAAAVTPEVVSLREQAEGLVRQVRSLRRTIKDSLAAKQFDGLLETVQQYLRIKPGDQEIGRLQQSVVEREEKVSAEIAARLEQAGRLEQSCRFDEAAKLLTAIPEPRRSAAIVAAVERAYRLSVLRKAALESLARAESGTYDAAIQATSGYRDAIAEARITDKDFSTLLGKAETEHAEEVRWRRMTSLAVKTASAIAAGIVVMLGGMWIRSSARQTSLAQAITRGRWDEALAIAPRNPEALVGRARAKLQATPAEIEGAFTDLEQALRQPGAGTLVQAALAEAHALRAAAEARAGRLDRANEDLQTAIRGGVDQAMLVTAKAAIADAWLARAEQCAAKGDGAGIKTAAEKALAAGASAAAVAPLTAKRMVLAAVTAQKKGDEKAAVSEMKEASRLDPGLVRATLTDPIHASLRSAVLAEHRGRFHEAVGNKDWQQAVQIAAAARAVDESAADWADAAVVSFPPAALASLPPDVVVKLPPMSNSLGMDLKLIPAGRFTMGEAGGKSDEKPHPVTLTKLFYLGVYEVTNAQWKRLMENVPSQWRADDRPVEQVSWEDAMEFCRRLSAIPEEKRNGRVYRLPTEAEWEYACRAGTNTAYSFGNDDSELGEYAWYVGNSMGQTHSVGQKMPNAWGLYEMHGNVFEWCSDWYSEYGSAAVTDPRGPSGGSGRVFRGGAWLYPSRDCRSAVRGSREPSYRHALLGFRVAVSLPEAQPLTPEAATAK